MKSIRKIAIAIVFAALLTGGASAADVEGELSDALGLDEIKGEAPAQIEEILGDEASISAGGLDSALERLGEYAGEAALGILRAGIKSAALLLTVVILCSIAESVSEGGAVADFVQMGGALAIAAASARDVSAFVGLGAKTLGELSDFSALLLPGLAASATAAGAISSGSAKYMAAALFMSILINAMRTLILPLIYAYITAVIANAAIGNGSLAGVIRLLKWLCTMSMTLLVISFTAYLGITGIISGASDAVAARAVKTTISTLLPVVGGIIADASGTLLTGASLLRNSIGIFGLVGVACVCLVPFLRLGIHYLMYKIVAGLSLSLSGGRLSGLISGLGDAFGMVMALVGSGAIILFFSIISSIKAVGYI